MNNILVEDLPVFRNWLKTALSQHVGRIEFVKKSGEKRLMSCTLQDSMLPKLIAEQETKPKQTKKENLDVLAVFDLECNEWRSFRLDSVTEISFTLEAKNA
jgi:hypothetical protein